MTSKDRIIAAIRHQDVDRMPVMLFSEPHATLKLSRDVRRPAKLSNLFGWNLCNLLSRYSLTEEMRKGIPLLFWFVQHSYMIELGTDAIDIFWSNPILNFRGIWLDKGKFRVKDNYGITRGLVGLYGEVIDLPCKTREDLKNYKFPNVSRDFYFNSVRRFRKRFPDVAILVWTMGVQDWTQLFHGLENLYLGMVDYPDIIKGFFKKMRDHSIDIAVGALRAGADIIMIGDDYGSQNSTFISKEMWEEFTFPHLKAQVKAIHDHGGIALLHSDGYIMPLLDRIVEAGVDAIHPLQPGTGNSLEEAKEKYGDRLAFFTGIDTQRLPRMTRREVRDQIIKAYKVGKKGGGFVLTTTHMIQEDTPSENLVEMFSTIRDIRRGIV